MSFPPGFLWGASTAAHQIEGGNVNSDWWQREWGHLPGAPVESPSGDAADSYHRYAEDMALLAVSRPGHLPVQHRVGADRAGGGIGSRAPRSTTTGAWSRRLETSACSRWSPSTTSRTRSGSRVTEGGTRMPRPTASPAMRKPRCRCSMTSSWSARSTSRTWSRCSPIPRWASRRPDSRPVCRRSPRRSSTRTGERSRSSAARASRPDGRSPHRRTSPSRAPKAVAAEYGVVARGRLPRCRSGRRLGRGPGVHAHAHRSRTARCRSRADAERTLTGWEYYPAAVGEGIRNAWTRVGRSGLRDRERHRDRRRQPPHRLHERRPRGRTRVHRRRHRRARISALERARQLRVGKLPPDVRSHRVGPRDVRAASEAQPGVARRGRSREAHSSRA